MRPYAGAGGTEMGSIVYLMFSLIAGAITFGFLWLILPSIFGVFFSTLDGLSANMSEPWRAVYLENQDTARTMVSLMATIGVVLLVIKSLMAATSRGAD